MRRIGDRQFLLAWQMTRAAAQPGPEATAWPIGEAFCRRYRHSLTTPDHSVVLDVCHIEQSGRRRSVTAHLMRTALRRRSLRAFDKVDRQGRKVKGTPSLRKDFM